MEVFLAVRFPDIAILKAFIYEPLCDKHIKDWNKDEENKDNQLHKEVYKVSQK